MFKHRKTGTSFQVYDLKREYRIIGSNSSANAPAKKVTEMSQI